MFRFQDIFQHFIWQIALSMTEYLIREEEYIPWVAAINNFQVRNKTYFSWQNTITVGWVA